MIQLFNGDCLDVMDKLIEDGVKVDAIITDPPYGTTACSWDSVIPFDAMWERLNKLIKPNGAIVLFGSEPFSSALRMSNIKNYKYDWVWDKITGTGHLTAKIRPMIRNENISVFNAKNVYNPQMEKLSDEQFKKKMSKIKSSKTYENKKQELTSRRLELGVKDRDTSDYDKSFPSNFLSISKFSEECNNTKRVHPTQKPVALMEYLIKTYTNENELVLDFTCGSGTTGVACKNTNRNFIGIELDKNYFKIAQDRIFDKGSLFNVND